MVLGCHPASLTVSMWGTSCLATTVYLPADLGQVASSWSGGAGLAQAEGP